MAVNHSADDRLRLAMPENIRKRPAARRPAIPGVAPAGLGQPTTPAGRARRERAVLLGNAGAITPSTRKML